MPMLWSKASVLVLLVTEHVASVLLQGTLTLLIGPPASGKSTLLKALTGRLKGAKSLQVSTLVLAGNL